MIAAPILDNDTPTKIAGDLLTIADVAERLHLRRATVRLWCKQRKLPCVYLSSRKILVSAAAVEAYLAQRAQPAADAA